MITKDDLDVNTLRVMDRLERIDLKLDRLLEVDKMGGRKMFGTSEVKQRLDISDSTLWRYRKKGLKSHKNECGHRVYYYDDLMEFIGGAAKQG